MKQTSNMSMKHFVETLRQNISINDTSTGINIETDDNKVLMYVKNDLITDEFNYFMSTAFCNMHEFDYQEYNKDDWVCYSLSITTNCVCNYSYAVFILSIILDCIINDNSSAESITEHDIDYTIKDVIIAHVSSTLTKLQEDFLVHN